MPTPKPKDGHVVDIVLVGVAIVWGSSYLVAKDLTAVAPVVVVLALRYIISALALAGVCLRTRQTVTGVAELAVGVLLGLTQAGVLTLETFAVATTSSTNAGLIISLTVVFTPVLDNLWARSWLPATFFIAATTGVLGVALLISGNGLAAPTWGDTLMLAAAGVRALHVTLIGRLTQDRQYSSVVLTTIQAIVGAVLLSAVAAGQLTRTIPYLPVSAWAQLAYLALACSAFAFIAQTWAIRRTSPSRASLLLGTEPVWAVATGISLGGDHLTATGGLGALMIISATYAGQHVERRHRRTGPPPSATPNGASTAHQPDEAAATGSSTGTL